MTSSNKEYKLEKATLDNLKRVVVERISNPAMIINDDTDEVFYTISYLIVTGNSSKRHTRKCSKEVFRKAYGKHPGGNPDTLPAGGWANLVGRSFVLYISKDEHTKEEVVNAITCLPNQFYGTSNAATVGINQNKTIEIIVYPNGQIEIPFYTDRDEEGRETPQIIAGVSKEEFIKALRVIDKASSLSVGQEITPKLRVQSIQGNHAFLVLNN